MKEILLASFGSWVFVYVLRLHTIFPFLNRKPFACEVCMAGWFTLILFLCPEWVDIPFYMSGAMIAVILLTKAMNKL